MRKRIGIVLIGMMTALTLPSCGSSKNNVSSRDTSAPAYYDTVPVENSYTDYFGNGSIENDMAEASADGVFGSQMASLDSGSSIDLTATAAEEQKLVYTCNMTLETLHYSDTMKAVSDLITQYDGMVESEDTSNNDYGWYTKGGEGGTWSTYLTVRIPADSYSEFLSGLEEMDVNVRNKSQNVDNITGVYSDQSILVEALKTQEQRLLEMMQQAETVEEMIAVEQRLTEVQTELNQAKAVLKGYNLDVNYSTVNLEVIEVRDYSVDVQETSLGERIALVFTESWSDFGHFLERLLEVLIYLFPFLILLVVVILAIVKTIKKARATNPRLGKQKHFRRKGRKDAAPEENVTQQVPETVQEDKTENK